jgi:hypothetical protein
MLITACVCATSVVAKQQLFPRQAGRREAGGDQPAEHDGRSEPGRVTGQLDKREVQ